MPSNAVRQAFLAGTGLATLVAALSAQQPAGPRPVRNDVVQAGQEVLVFRHQLLRKGGHEAYFNLSRDGVWPWFEKIGSRIVGQWMVVHPDGQEEDPEHDHGYRLARYASYEHWKATRRGHLLLGGDGPDFQRSRESLRARGHFTAGSHGAHFLRGVTATTRPYFMPALEESFEPAKTRPPGGPRPVRNDLNWPAPEIAVLEVLRVRTGSAAKFIEVGVRQSWPFLEKIGARPVGIWQEFYPAESGFQGSPEHDVVFMLVRYAGFKHWIAAQPAEIVRLGGDGNDYEAYRGWLGLQDSDTLERKVVFLQGHMYNSPPKFMPGLREEYRQLK